METIKVAFVEDNSALRKRFVEQFEFFDDIKLVATYATGETALNGLRSLPPSRIPDIVLMDIELPGMSGIEATIALRELMPEIEIMMFTVFEDEVKIFQAIQAGAAGYMLKDDPIEAVGDGIRELFNGGAPMSQSIARTVLSFLRGKHNGATKRSPEIKVHEPVDFDLSERELELTRVGITERTRAWRNIPSAREETVHLAAHRQNPHQTHLQETTRSLTSARRARCPG